MRQNRAIHTARGALYARQVRVRTGIDLCDPLTLLHRAACQEVAWLLGKGPTVPPFSRGAALRLLEEERRRLCADRDRRLHGLLHHYCEAVSGFLGAGASRVQCLFAPKFEHVWERMVRVAFGGWSAEILGDYALDGRSVQREAKLVGDAVSDDRWRGGRVRVVIDAKDYALGSMPPTHDITKQTLYRLLLSGAQPPGAPTLSSVGNCFVMPRVLPGRGLQLLALHSLAGTRAGAPAYGRVVVVGADLRTVSEAFLRGAT